MKVIFYVCPSHAILHANENYGNQIIDLDLATLNEAQRSLIARHFTHGKDLVDLTKLHFRYEIPVLNEHTALQALDKILFYEQKEKEKIEKDNLTVIQDFLQFLKEFENLDFSSPQADAKCEKLIYLTSGAALTKSQVIRDFLHDNPTIQEIIDGNIFLYKEIKEQAKLKKLEEKKLKKQQLKDWVLNHGPTLLKDRLTLGFDWEELASKKEFEERFSHIDLPIFPDKEFNVCNEYDRTKPAQHELNAYRKVQEQVKHIPNITLDLVRIKYDPKNYDFEDPTTTTEIAIRGTDLLGQSRSIYFWVQEEK